MALLAFFGSVASADIIFSESFESPVVSGFDDNTVPDNGNWIGATNGFGSSNRGLYNESVVFPDTPPFTTPYGDQAYYLNYTNSALTTAQGVIAETLTAGELYTIKFNTAVVAGNESSGYTYLVEFLAFEPTDDNVLRRDGQAGRPGTVLASAAGGVTTTDMSQEITFTFTPDGSDPSLGKELGLRLVKAGGTVLYDNVRLIAGHDYAPSPADGEDILAGGDVNLSWTNLPPTAPATETPVDILFGTDPGSLSIEVDGQVTGSAVVNAPTAGTYYWRIDSYPDGDPDGTPVTGDVFSFTIADTDGDGLPDDYELAHTDPASPTALDPTSDLDSDDLTAAQEYQFGTDPTEGDTDGDTLLDGHEINGTAGLRPPTNPLIADSDGDGLNDGVESNTGTWVSASDSGTDPTDSDYDNDGLNDGAETNTGTLVDRFDTGTDPYNPDTDDDGVGDYYEVVAAYTDPHDDQSLPGIPYPLPDPDPSDLGTADVPVKVYIMAGQSNMVGIGYMGDVNQPGSMEAITKVDNKFPNFLDASNEYTKRNDVIYRGVVTANTNNGPLTVRQGADGTRVGVELGFGHVMGYYHGEPVLLIKASQGNRSLAWDYAPPGSPRFDFGGTTYAGYGDTDDSWPAGGDPDDVGTWYCGKEFDQAFLDESDWAPAGQDDDPIINAADVLDFDSGTLQNLPTDGNNLNGRTFEIAGFVWWQGHKDGGEDRTGSAGAYATQYESRLERLINSLRTEFNAPSAPFVVATVGFGGGGWDPGSSGDTIYNAQLNVSDPSLYPAFESNVASVDTTGYWRGAEESPGGQGFHYMNNAETYTLVGDAMGRAMIELLEAAAADDTIPPVIISKSPADDAEEVSAGQTLTATFNEIIAIGTGNITLVNLTDGPAGNIVIDVTDSSQVSVSTQFLTINPTSNLGYSKEYAVQIDSTALTDMAGNAFDGIGDTTTWSFTTSAPDTTAPGLVSLDPADNTDGVLPDMNFEATFNEPITVVSGNITFLNLTDGTSGNVVIDVTDTNQVTVDGDTLIINPTNDLLGEKNYAIQIDATAIDDLVGNSYGGITDTTTWNFSTPTPPPPGVVFADDFEAGTNIWGGTTPDVSSYTVANTSRQANTALWVRATEGHNATRNGLVDESENGGASFTDPTGEQAYGFRYTNSGVTTAEGVIGALTAGTTYTVSFDVVVDGSSGSDAYNAYLVTFNGGARNDVRANTGATSTLTSVNGTASGSTYEKVTMTYTADGTEATLGHDVALRFYGGSRAIIDNVQVAAVGDDEDTTAPAISTLSPTDGSTGVAVGTDLVVTFNEDIAAGTGNITLKNLTDNSQSTIAITDGTQVTVSGVTLTINPTSDLAHGKNYAIQVGTTAVADLAGNPFAGITDDTSWNFTTIAANFNDWMSDFGHDYGTEGGPDDDYDGDGDTNAEENFFGTDPGNRSASLTTEAVTVDTDTTFTFTHPINENPAPDLTAIYIWSKDLITFYTSGASDGETTVTLEQGTPVDGQVTVTATVSGVATRVFVEVFVTQD
jgi:hypothetical protein